MGLLGGLEDDVDDVENARLVNLCDDIFCDFSGKADLSIIINPSGQQGKNFSTTGEYVHCYFQDESNMLAKELRDEESADVRGFMNGAKGVGVFKSSVIGFFLYAVHILAAFLGGIMFAPNSVEKYAEPQTVRRLSFRVKP